MSEQQHPVQRILLSVYFIIFFWIWFIIVSVTTFFLWLFQVKQIKRIISKRKGKKLSVLYLEVFSPQSAGNKYRTTKWMQLLNQQGFRAESKYVFEYSEYLRLTSQQETMLFFHMEFLWRRLFQCLSSLSYDMVIVRREILMFNDYGNLFFEKLLFNCNSHLILDFDDDISAAKREPREISFYGKLLLEHPEKFSKSLKYFTAFMPATNYLKQKLIEKNPHIKGEQILVVPTCVDYDKFPPKTYSSLPDELTIGWVGARNNLENVLQVIPTLNNLSSRYRFQLLIICDRPLMIPALFPIQNIPWSEKREIENLHLIDIGIMPLSDNMESKGKAGFKLIQYMGCGIVSIATALTVNNEIVDDGINGFLVSPDADWTTVFEKVFQQKQNFAVIGKRAFEKIAARYSFTANQEAYIQFLQQQVTIK